MNTTVTYAERAETAAGRPGGRWWGASVARQVRAKELSGYDLMHGCPHMGLDLHGDL